MKLSENVKKNQFFLLYIIFGKSHVLSLFFPPQTSGYEVPPVPINPSFNSGGGGGGGLRTGYFPPSQRSMPRVNREFLIQEKKKKKSWRGDNLQKMGFFFFLCVCEGLDGEFLCPSSTHWKLHCPPSSS